jgi:hypothetical protein
MIRSNRIAALVALALPLGACSGGGGGAGLGSVPPAPVNPAAQSNTSLTDLRLSETLVGDAARMKYRVSASGTASGFDPNVALVSNTLGVRYDAATQSYTVVGDFTSPAFGPAQRSSSNATLTNYERQSGTKQENLTLFNAGSGNTRLALTYASFGAYQTIDTGTGSDLGVDTVFFNYGVRTSAADMPRTGTANYDTNVDGLFAGSTGVYSLTGDSSFTADFAASTVSATLSLRGEHVVSGATKLFTPQALSGTIRSDTNGQHFSARGGDPNGTSSDMMGMFYGPGAAEIGGVFGISTPEGKGTGAIVGKKR